MDDSKYNELFGGPFAFRICPRITKKTITLTARGKLRFFNIYKSILYCPLYTKSGHLVYSV